VAGTFRLVFVVFNTLFALPTQDDQVQCSARVAESRSAPTAPRTYRCTSGGRRPTRRRHLCLFGDVLGAGRRRSGPWTCSVKTSSELGCKAIRSQVGFGVTYCPTQTRRSSCLSLTWRIAPLGIAARTVVTPVAWKSLSPTTSCWSGTRRTPQGQCSASPIANGPPSRWRCGTESSTAADH
jgi:hypothetical protein